MHQAGGLVKDIFDELESELLQDFLRSMIVWVMPGIDFRQLQSFPGIFERAEGSFGSEPFAPTAPHEMEPHFEIRLAVCVDPGPKPAAADKIAISVIEQRPILNTAGSLSLDLGVEFLLGLGFREFAARINERRNGGIAPQFHRERQILDLS
jgi:hypothetical protein